MERGHLGQSLIINGVLDASVLVHQLRVAIFEDLEVLSTLLLLSLSLLHLLGEFRLGSSLGAASSVGGMTYTN